MLKKSTEHRLFKGDYDDYTSHAITFGFGACGDGPMHLDQLANAEIVHMLNPTFAYGYKTSLNKQYLRTTIYSRVTAMVLRPRVLMPSSI